MSETVITLPDREEMLRRLRTVSANSDLSKRFYPILLQHAEQNRVVVGIVMMFSVAVNDYTTGMPTGVEMAVWNYVPAWIDALVDDQDVAAEAKAGVETVLNNSAQ